MKRLIFRLLPRGWIEWSVLVVAALAYVNWTTKVLLRAEAIPYQIEDSGWSIAERIVAFPAFYIGVDPLTGLIINALLWGLFSAKIAGWLAVLVNQR